MRITAMLTGPLLTAALLRRYGGRRRRRRDTHAHRRRVGERRGAHRGGHVLPYGHRLQAGAARHGRGLHGRLSLLGLPGRHGTASDRDRHGHPARVRRRPEGRGHLAGGCLRRAAPPPALCERCPDRSGRRGRGHGGAALHAPYRTGVGRALGQRSAARQLLRASHRRERAGGGSRAARAHGDRGVHCGPGRGVRGRREAGRAAGTGRRRRVHRDRHRERERERNGRRRGRDGARVRAGGRLVLGPVDGPLDLDRGRGVLGALAGIMATPWRARPAARRRPRTAPDRPRRASGRLRTASDRAAGQAGQAPDGQRGPRERSWGPRLVPPGPARGHPAFADSSNSLSRNRSRFARVLAICSARVSDSSSRRPSRVFRLPRTYRGHARSAHI